jgi:DNA-binding LacI/PurR family transcriptional regulator
LVATLKDVASLAGVSAKTVSNVVNGYAFVKPDNRRRVLEAMSAVGYRPNIGARNLRRGRTGFIALVVPELSIPYFGELSGLIITAAQERDWNVLIEQTQGERDRERSTLAALGPHIVDGTILSPEALQTGDFTELAQGISIVMLGEHKVDLDIDHVAIDNVLAAQTAVAHLIGIGRRRIAVIGQNPHRGTAALRLEGYRKALASAGLPQLSELVVPAQTYHRRDGAEAMAQLLSLPERPDAVFCFNDLLAFGALRAAADRGLRIPEDIAIVGFDNTEESGYSLPSLTTIAPNKLSIARTAIDLLHRRVSSAEQFPPQDIQTTFSLEVRESTVGR